MDLKIYANNPELCKVYLQRNGITGAFIWPDDDHKNKWTVYIGDAENACGWKEAENLTKREALKLCGEYQEVIDRLNPKG